MSTCIIVDGERKSERKLEKKPRTRRSNASWPGVRGEGGGASSCQSEGKGRQSEEKLERKPKIMRAYSSWVNVGERYNNNNNGGKKL